MSEPPSAVHVTRDLKEERCQCFGLQKTKFPRNAVIIQKLPAASAVKDGKDKMRYSSLHMTTVAAPGFGYEVLHSGSKAEKLGQDQQQNLIESTAETTSAVLMESLGDLTKNPSITNIWKTG